MRAVTIDASHIASACLTISSTMGSVLDGSSAIFGFNVVGIELAGGHEAMVCVRVCVCACVYVYMYICIYVCMYVCMYV